MKRVAITSNTSFSLYNFRLGLMRTLKEKGVEVIAISSYDKYAKKLEEEFIYIPLKNLDRKGTNPIKDFLLFFEYLTHYIKIKPNLVINFTIKPNIYSSFACGILKIPCISVITGLGYVFLKGGFLQKLIKILYKIAFKFNKYIVVLNSDDLKMVSTFAKKERIKLIESEGVNTDYFHPNFCKENKKTNLLVFLFIGRFLKDKGIYQLAEAAKRLWQEGYKFELWFLGDVDLGNPATLQERELKELKRLEFVKFLPFTEDVRPIICLSDCVVLPSYREGIPRTLLEAMAMEKPIITTDAPGCKEVILDGINGFITRTKDAKSLYEAMRKFIDLSKEDKKLMGKKGRDIVLSKFDEKIIIKQYIELFMEIIN